MNTNDGRRWGPRCDPVRLGQSCPSRAPIERRARVVVIVREARFPTRSFMISSLHALARSTVRLLLRQYPGAGGRMVLRLKGKPRVTGRRKATGLVHESAALLKGSHHGLD